MNLEADYRAKCLSADEFVAGLKSGNRLTFGIWFGQPLGVMRALAKLPREIEPLFVSISFATDEGEFLHLPNVYCQSSFWGPHERAANRQRPNVFYLPIQYTDAHKTLRALPPPDYFVRRVAPMDERGFFNFSLTASWEYDAIRWLAAHSPRTRVVFEVNRHLPPIPGLPQFGNNEIHLSQVSYIIEDHRPLLDFPTPEPNDLERSLARHVAALIEDRATIQLGIGTIPMAIGKLLTDRRNLGIHTEMFCQAHMDLIEAGCVSNAYKGLYDGISVATFVLGDHRLVRWAGNNSSIALLPVEEINAVPVLAKVNNLISINNGLTVDLAGQVCAHCLGAKTYSGLGGAFEFVYGSQLSPGGKSIMCLRSTAVLKDGSEVSNIVSRHPPGTRVTIPEHCVDWIVTEFGAARLKFLNLDLRVEALINIAHPKFRGGLTRQARENGWCPNKVRIFRGH